MKSGILLLRKPAGFTSFDCVAKLRKILKTKKIGHAGTLDPFATGLLVLGVNRATRFLQFFETQKKVYRAEIIFGKFSKTHDCDGEICEKNLRKFDREKLEKILAENFNGEILQTPPQFSAKKIGGKKAYEFARAGKRVILKPQ